MAARRFSQAISEGDGISVLVEVHDVESARLAEAQRAEAIVLRGPIDGIREATELPLLWRGAGPLEAAARAAADACLLVVADHREDGELEALQAEATSLGLESVVEVRNEEELEVALERLDPEIFLLSRSANDDEDALERALDLLPDIPAGKLAIAEVPVSTRAQVDELERAGVDAVIVGTRDVAELVGQAPPQV